MKKIAFLLLGAFVLVSCQQEKTAYVDNAKLMKNYSAMQSNKKSMDARRQKLQSTMRAEGQKFQKEVETYRKNSKTMSKAQKDKRRKELMAEQQKLRQKQQVQGSLMQSQTKKVNDSLKKVMHGKIADYAKDHGYSYVFGMNEDDNILYAKDSKNITQDVLKILNGESSKNDSSSKPAKKKAKMDSTTTN